MTPWLVRRRRPSTAITTATGSTRPNIHRQDSHWSTTPETAGPSAGATDMDSVTLPITRPRSCCGTTVISVVISSGIITAVPPACTTRATSRTWKLGATAARRVPAQKTVIAVAKAARVVTR